MKKVVLASVMATVFSGTAMASSVPTSTDAHFNRVEARYVDFDDYEPDVYGLSGRVMLNDDFYLTADYFHHSYNGASLDQLIAGVGYKHDINETLSLFADINAGYADGSNDYDETGYAVQAGTVYRINKSFELSGLVRHADFDEDTQEVELAARWYINDKFSLSATYLDGFDSDVLEGYFIGAAYHF